MYNRPETLTKEYKKWVSAVIRRCRGRCVACGKPSKCAHHLDGWSWAFTLRYEPSNGVILCTGRTGKYGMGCHNHFHKLYGRGDNTRYQFDCYLRLYHNKKLSDIL